MRTVLLPIPEPAGDAILRRAVGNKRGDQLADGGLTLAVFARESADRALGQLAEVVFDVTDRLVDRARQRVLGGKGNLSDARHVRGQRTLRFFRDRVYFRDAGGLARREERVSSRKNLLGFDVVTIDGSR